MTKITPKKNYIDKYPLVRYDEWYKACVAASAGYRDKADGVTEHACGGDQRIQWWKVVVVVQLR